MQNVVKMKLLLVINICFVDVMLFSLALL